MPTGAESFSEAMRLGVEVYHSLATLLKSKFGKSAANVGDEGGFGAPQIEDENHSLELITEAIHNAGHTGRIDISLDPAASEFYNAENKTYNFSQKAGGDNQRIFNQEQSVELYANLAANYPIVSIEDPFDQDDWTSFKMLTDRIGDKVQIVGDDIFVTNPVILERGIREGVANALLLKVN